MKTWLESFPHWQDRPIVHPALAGLVEDGPADAAELAYARWVDAADKTEVHVHAEAAVPAGFYAALSGQAPLTPQPFLDIDDFLRRWMANLAQLRSAADYAALGRALVADRDRRRITRCECHVSLLDTSIYRPRLAPELAPLDLEASLGHFAAGLRDGMVAAGGRVQVRAVVDLVSIAAEADLDAAYGVLAAFVDAADNRDADGGRIVVAIGLGGPELPARAGFFAGALQRFRRLGLRLDLHSGEQPHVTPAEHRRSLVLLRPDRVGHGIRGAAAGFFFEGALAACPLSNVLLRCHEGGLASHPIGEMWRRGLNVSVNSDDPLLLGTNLVLEYVALRRALGLAEDFFAATQANARRQLLAGR